MHAPVRELTGGKIKIRTDGHQEIVEVVGESGGESTDRIDLLRPKAFILKLPMNRHVLEVAADATGLVAPELGAHPARR